MTLLKNGIKVGEISVFRGGNWEPYRQQVVFCGVHSLVWNAKAGRGHRCGSTYWACLQEVQVEPCTEYNLNQIWIGNIFEMRSLSIYTSHSPSCLFISVTDPFNQSQSHCTTSIISIACILSNCKLFQTKAVHLDDICVHNDPISITYDKVDLCVMQEIFLKRWDAFHWWDLTFGWVGREVSKIS
jgi:hypothetical protein